MWAMGYNRGDWGNGGRHLVVGCGFRVGRVVVGWWLGGGFVVGGGG